MVPLSVDNSDIQTLERRIDRFQRVLATEEMLGDGDGDIADRDAVLAGKRDFLGRSGPPQKLRNASSRLRLLEGKPLSHHGGGDQAGKADGGGTGAEEKNALDQAKTEFARCCAGPEKDQRVSAARGAMADSFRRTAVPRHAAPVSFQVV